MPESPVPPGADVMVLRASGDKLPVTVTCARAFWRCHSVGPVASLWNAEEKTCTHTGA